MSLFGKGNWTGLDVNRDGKRDWFDDFLVYSAMRSKDEKNKIPSSNSHASICDTVLDSEDYELIDELENSLGIKIYDLYLMDEDRKNRLIDEAGLIPDEYELLFIQLDILFKNNK